MPLCPLVIALVPLKCSSRHLQFPHRVPFAKEKMPWCPCPFKNEAYRPEPVFSVYVQTCGTSGSIGHRSCRKTVKEKKSLSQIQILGWKLPLSLKLHYFKVFRFETKFDSVSRSSVPFTENIIMVLKICIHFIYFIKKKLLYDRNLR